MSDYGRYVQRVISQRDDLQKLYRERHLVSRLLESINRYPESSITSSARFRCLTLEARLNDAIVAGERTERRLSLIGSVARYDANGNNTNGPNNNNNRNNPNTPNGNNTNLPDGSVIPQENHQNNNRFSIKENTLVFFSI